MKTIKFIAIVILLFVSMGVSAQLKVESSGDVKIGTKSTGGSTLDVYKKGCHTALNVSGEDMCTGGDIFKVGTDSPNAHAIATWCSGLGKTFFVTASGGVYSNFQLITSDIKTKKNIESISSPLQKVLKLRGVTFESKYSPSESDYTNMLQEAASRSTTERKLSAEFGNDNEEMSLQTARQIYSEKNRKHMGVIAQEVEAVVPEVVRTSSNGIKAVSYVELVGLLIEAIKEQQVQIEELKAQSTTLTPISKTKSKAEANSSDISSTVVNSNKLHQNVPNPFTISTEIRYFLEDGAGKANLYIYDMQGKQIKNISNLTKGDGSVIINGHELSAGMYIYSLIVDGAEVDTKRMILTD